MTTSLEVAVPEIDVVEPVDVEQLLLHAAGFLKRYGNARTMTEYARDFGLPYLVKWYGLDDLVIEIAGKLNKPALLKALKGREPSEQNVTVDLCWFVACVNGRVDPYDVTGEHIEKWVGAMLACLRDDGKRALSNEAIQRRLAGLSSFYKWARKRRLIAFNPVHEADLSEAGIEVDRHRGKTTGWTRKQMNLLVAAAREYPGPTRLRTAAIVALLCALGLRVDEATGLDVADYFDDTGQRVVEVTRKGGRRQRIPVPPKVAKAIDAWLASRPELKQLVPLVHAGAGKGGRGVLLFATLPYQGKPGGRRLDETSVRKTLQLVAAQVPELLDVAATLHPHMLRATLAQLLRDEPLDKIMELFGWKDPATAMRYIRQAIDLSESLAHKGGDMIEGVADLEAEDAA